MGNAISSLFGGKPKKPAMVVQPTPIEKVTETNISDDTVRRELAKKRRATILAAQDLAPANIQRKELGAGI